MPAPLFSRLVAKLFARTASRQDRRRASRLGLEALEARDVPAVTFGIEKLSDATEGGAAGQFRVTATGDASDFTNAVYAIWNTNSGTASPTNDYTTSPGTGYYLVFSASGATATITVTPVDDSDVEGDETVGLTVQRYQMYPMGPQTTGTLTIHDNDFPPSPPPPPPPVVAVTGVSDAIEGGDAGVFRFTRSGSTGSSLTVSYSFASGPGRATPGPDFVDPGGTVVIPAGSAYQDVPIAAWADNDFDPDEKVKISIEPSPTYTRLGDGTALIPVIDTSFVVTTTADTVDTTDNRVSLREAMLVANVAPRVDHRIISFNFPGTTGTITLGSTLPTIEKSIYIAGPGDRGVTITGAVRHMQVNPGADVMLAGITFLNGHSPAAGGAIYTEGTLAVTNCEFRGNIADDDGGAIAAARTETDFDATLSIDASLFNGNSADSFGGGVSVVAMPTFISNTTFVLNTATTGGGGVMIITEIPLPDPDDENPPPGPSRGLAVFINVQLQGNSSRNGGGVYVQGTSLTLEGGTTFVENVASDSGGGLFAMNSAVTVPERDARFDSNQAETGRGMFLDSDSYVNGLPVLTGGDNIVGGAD